MAQEAEQESFYPKLGKKKLGSISNNNNNKEEKEKEDSLLKDNETIDGANNAEAFQPGADDDFTDRQNDDYVMGDAVTKMGELDLEVDLQPEGNIISQGNDGDNKQDNKQDDNNNNNNNDKYKLNPTFFGIKNDDFKVEKHAKQLKKVFHWYKSNTEIRNTIIDVIGSLNEKQRLELMAFYNKNYKTHLAREIAHYTQGPLRDCLLSLLMSHDAYICQWIDYALNRNDINLLVVILCTLDENKINEIKDTYNKIIHVNQDNLEKRITSKTSNWFHKRNVLYVLLNIYNGKSATYENNNKPDQILLDAKNLIKASKKGGMNKVDKNVFIEIFTSRNLSHLKAVSIKYKELINQDKNDKDKNKGKGKDKDKNKDKKNDDKKNDDKKNDDKKNDDNNNNDNNNNNNDNDDGNGEGETEADSYLPLVDLVGKLFKESSETGHACKIILYFATRKYELLSDLLDKSLRLHGPNYEFLNRIVVTYCESELGNILDVYGKEKLKNWLNDQFKKNNKHINYYKLILKLCNLE